MAEKKEQKRVPGYKSENQKYKSLLVMQYILKNADDEHAVTIGQIEDHLAKYGIDALRDFIVELGIPLTLREIGATRDMLKKIAYSVEEGGGYKFITHEEMLEILEECF